MKRELDEEVSRRRVGEAFRKAERVEEPAGKEVVIVRGETAAERAGRG